MRSFLLGLLAIGLGYTANAQTSKEELQQAKIDSLTTVIQDLRTNQQNIQKQIETVDKMRLYGSVESTVTLVLAKKNLKLMVLMLLLKVNGELQLHWERHFICIRLLS